MGATSWTEQSQTSSTWYEGLPGPAIEGYALFGLPIPIEIGLSYSGVTSTWTEHSQSATAMTEMSQTASTWTEITG